MQYIPSPSPVIDGNTTEKSDLCDQRLLDPHEWVKEHYFLASMSSVLHCLPYIFPEDSQWEQKGEVMVLSGSVKQFLRERYNEEHWHYIEALFS